MQYIALASLYMKFNVLAHGDYHHKYPVSLIHVLVRNVDPSVEQGYQSWRKDFHVLARSGHCNTTWLNSLLKTSDYSFKLFVGLAEDTETRQSENIL